MVWYDFPDNRFCSIDDRVINNARSVLQLNRVLNSRGFFIYKKKKKKGVFGENRLYSRGSAAALPGRVQAITAKDALIRAWKPRLRLFWILWL